MAEVSKLYSGRPDYTSGELPPIPNRVKDFARKNDYLWGPEDNPYGVAGYMTYAPNGAMLKHNIELAFWQLMVQEYGYFPIITPSFGLLEQWQASGHYQQFSQEMLHAKTQRGQQLVGRGELATTLYPFLRQISNFFNAQLPFKIYSVGNTKLNFNQTQWQTYTQEYTAHEGHILVESKAVQVEQFVAAFESLAYQIMEAAGLDRHHLTFREKESDEKPFYAHQAWGLFANHFNDLELLGVQYRGSDDFRKHTKATQKKLRVLGAFPEVFEISWSTDRPFICLLQATISTLADREVLLLPDHLIPHPAEITPTVKRFGLPEQAEKVRQKINRILQPSDVVLPAVNLKGSKAAFRYQDADRKGIPFVIVIDPDCKPDEFMLRERNSGSQVKTSVADLSELMTQIAWGTSTVEIFRTLYQLKK